MDGVAAGGLRLGALAGTSYVAQAHHAAGYKVGSANDRIGNGWREEMICTANVETLIGKTPVQERQLYTALMIPRNRKMISQFQGAVSGPVQGLA